MPFYYLPNLDFWQYVGVVGALIYVTRYLFVAFNRLPSQYPAHYWTTLIAALMVMVSLFHAFNLAAALTQFFSIIVSVIGIARHSGASGRRNRVEREEKLSVMHEDLTT